MGLLAALGAIALIAIAIILIAYVLWSMATMKVLKAFEYHNAWMAWIPVLNLFALAQLTTDENGNTEVIQWKMPTMIFSFWFVVGWVLLQIPNVGSLLNTVLQVICLGTCFINIYSKAENKSEKDVKVLAYVSGFIPIIALVKFLQYKPETIADNIKAAKAERVEIVESDEKKQNN